MERAESKTFVGDLVEVRGDRWQVSSIDARADCTACGLRGVSRLNLGEHRTLLMPFDRLRRVYRPPGERRVSRCRALLAARALLAGSPPFGRLRTALFAQVDVLPYQLEPVLACLQGAVRLLLADEVGLGKTVQAALIIAELQARGEASRVLIVCPAGICVQWREELADRFGLAVEVIDNAALRQLAAISTPEHGPWDRVPMAVVSMDFIKQPEVLRGMGSARWDLVVVDEAHLVARARERGAAIQQLATRAGRVVLLTATPHAGDESAFAALCAVGQLPSEEPVLMFRRTRASLGLPGARRTSVLRVRLSPAERQLHTALDAYAKRVCRAGLGLATSEARLAMTVLRKRAGSGPFPLLASLLRRLAFLAPDNPDAPVQLALPLRGEAAQDEEEVDSAPGMVLAAPGLTDAAVERQTLERLVMLAREAVPTDRKLAALRRLLRRAQQPALVFTEYRDTLEWLARNLSSSFRVAILHGRLTEFERHESVQAFVAGNADLLLATDAAAHGLNLQPRSRLVVHVELPWNPVRLEQRVGRLDRIGQTQRVHAVHLVGGLGEMDVLARVLEKVGRARAAIGTGPSGLGDATAPGGTGSVARARSPHESAGVPGPRHLPHVRVAAQLEHLAEEEAKRLRTLRLLLAHPPAISFEQLQQVLADVAARGSWVAGSNRPSGDMSTLVFVFGATMADGTGFVLEESLVPIAVREHGRRAGGEPQHPRASPELLACLASTARARLRERLVELLEERRKTLAPVRTRAARIAALVHTAGRDPVQAGLFDRRAQQQQERRESWEGRVRDESLARCSRLRLASQVTAGDVELRLSVRLRLERSVR